MIKDQIVFDFMRYRKMAAAISIVLVVISIAAIALRGINFGLDFTGGTVIELGYEKSTNLNEIRSKVSEIGYDANVVNFGSDRDVLVRIQTDENGVGDKVLSQLQSSQNPVILKRTEFVGPQVGEELRDDGGLALLAALLIVMVYVAFRFQFKFSVASVIALIHDVIISLGFFALFQWDFDLTVLAALLAVIGYSLNDTIVVSDRIRENFLNTRSSTEAEVVVNASISQMLGRTMVTSLTTLIVVVILFFFGGEVIKGFSTALIIGIVVGTYSSIYVAANILMGMKVSKEDLMEKPKDDAEFEGLP